MKILFLTENFPPETNAAATRVFERACHWVEDGHDVTVVTCAPNFPNGRVFDGYRNVWSARQEMAGIKVIRVKTYIAPNRGVGRRTLDFLSFGATGFWAALWAERPDVVAATSPQFFAAVAGWAAAFARNLPFVFELGDLWPASISAVGAMRPSLALQAVEQLELFLYRQSSAIAALTGSFKENLVARGIDTGKIAVVMNGVDISRYGPRPPDAELAAKWGLTDRFVVGYVGTHGMAHALGNVLNAAERLRKRPEIRFLLVGSGAERQALIADAARRGLDNVVFAPPQPKDMMPRVWSLCDVALVHLKNSPVFAGVIPSKIFEAMGMGLPLLLAAPEGEASRIVAGHEAGLVVPPEDPEALAAAAVQLFEDADLRKKLSLRSLGSAPRHTRQRQAEEMLRVLRMAAEGRGRDVGRDDAS